MIIEIKDLPRNQKIKRIEFSVVFDDSETIQDNSGTKEWQEVSEDYGTQFIKPPKPLGPENEVIKESLFTNVEEPGQRIQEPIPPEMQDIEL